MSKQCRICLAEEGDNNGEDLGAWLRPCRCKGTQEWIHANCLKAWRSQIHNVHPDYCATCNARYPDSTCLKGYCRALRNRATFEVIEAAKVLGPIIVFCACVLFLELQCDARVPLCGDPTDSTWRRPTAKNKDCGKNRRKSSTRCFYRPGKHQRNRSANCRL